MNVLALSLISVFLVSCGPVSPSFQKIKSATGIQSFTEEQKSSPLVSTSLEVVLAAITEEDSLRVSNSETLFRFSTEQLSEFIQTQSCELNTRSETGSLPDSFEKREPVLYLWFSEELFEDQASLEVLQKHFDESSYSITKKSSFWVQMSSTKNSPSQKDVENVLKAYLLKAEVLWSAIPETERLDN